MISELAGSQRLRAARRVAGVAARPHTADADGTDAELGRVSLLFADIHASTDQISTLEPEQALGLLGPPVRMMAEVVQRYHGAASMRGDGIMAVFGRPMLAEGHAIRACFAALEILEEAAALGTGIRVRVGIHVGDVVVGIGADGGLLIEQVFGSAVHVAARLEQTTQPGTVCMSRALHEMVRNLVHVAPMPPVNAKGMNEPIERALLLGINHAPNRWRGPAAQLGRFFNRERELAMLAAASRQPGLHVVQIVGEAGIGKSRLLREFEATDAAHQGYIVPLVGHKLRRHVPFDTLGDWLRDILDLQRATAGHGRLHAALARLGDFTEQDIALLERVLGLQEPKQRDAAEQGARLLHDLANTVGKIVRRASGGRRVLLLCEDFDLFDPTTRLFLPDLIEALADGPVAVITTSRKLLRFKLAACPAPQTIRMRPLSADHATRMLTELMPRRAVEPGRLTALLQKTGGNPLYLEEVATLAGQQETGTGEEIPDRIESVIVDRLSRLPRDQRQLLRMASVIGFDVPTRLLSSLSGMELEPLERILARLQTEHILYDTSGFGDHRCSFKHALTREVVYKSILRRERRELHGRIVGLIESDPQLAGEGRLADLCHHSIQARLWDRAIHYLQDVAAVAAERGALEQASEHLKQALALADNLQPEDQRLRTRIAILLGLRTVAVLELRYQDALTLLEEAEALAIALNEPLAALTVRGRRLRILNVLGRLEEAAETGESLLGESRSMDRADLTADLAHDLGQTYFYKGDFVRAHAVFTEAAEQASLTSAGPLFRAASLSLAIIATSGASLAFLGRFTEAEEQIARALALADQTARPYDLVYARFIDGLQRLLRRELDDAIRIFRATLAEAEANGVHTFIPSLQTGLGHALLLQAEARRDAVQPVIDLLTGARTTATDRRREIIRLWATLVLGMAHFSAGHDRQALEMSLDAVQVGTRFGMHGFLVTALRYRGLILAADPGTATEGLRCVVQALRLARRLRMSVEVAHGLLAADLVCGIRTDRRISRAGCILAACGMQGWRRTLLERAGRLALRRAF